MGKGRTMSAPYPIDVNLSRIAHDLRGPLMPLRTAAWLLRNERADSVRVPELADIVDRQSVLLARMLDELSDWGRLSSDQTGLKPEPTDVSLMMDMTIGSLANCQAEPSIKEDAAAFPLHADLQRLSQLLRTLVEHAVYRDPSHPPEITLRVASGQLEIHVVDHGKPLDESELQDLLRRPQTSPFDNGLGLRLLIARRIAEEHGGSLEVDQSVQAGLGIICTLPPAQ